MLPRVPRVDSSPGLLLGLCAALGLGCGEPRPGDAPFFDVPGVEAAVAEDQPLGALQSTYPAYDLSYQLPYRGAARSFSLEVEPRATRLDVQLLVDASGSFGGEIANLKLTLGNIVVPALRRRVADLAMGVARFADFPVLPFGNANDLPYELLTPITTDFNRVGRAVLSLDMPLMVGGDGPESWAEALFQVASGQGYVGPLRTTIAPFVPPRDTPPGALPGGVGFRLGSARVVVAITDAPAHEPHSYSPTLPGTRSTADAAQSLGAVNARLLGIASGPAARPQLEAIALATGGSVPAVGNTCQTGIGGTFRPAPGPRCPLVYDINPDGSGLGQTVVDGIARFLDSLAFLTVRGGADDDRGFVQAIEAVSAVAPEGAPTPRREDRDADGIQDTFLEVPTRTRLTFRVVLQNLQVVEGEFPQVFFVRVRLVGDGVVVGERTVRVIVPEAPKPDAGPDGSADAARPPEAGPGPDAGPPAFDATVDAPRDATSESPADARPDAAASPPPDGGAGGDADPGVDDGAST